MVSSKRCNVTSPGYWDFGGLKERGDSIALTDPVKRSDTRRCYPQVRNYQNGVVSLR